jgi:hypothetical protein
MTEDNAMQQLRDVTNADPASDLQALIAACRAAAGS